MQPLSEIASPEFLSIEHKFQNRPSWVFLLLGCCSEGAAYTRAIVFLTTRLISPHLGTVCSPDPTPEIWIQNESRQVPGTCSHKQASSGGCSSDRIQRRGSPQPHLPHPECPVFPLKPHFHHLLGGQLLSPGHCSSGRCALSWNHPVRSPERTFPIPKKLASSWSWVPSSSLSCLT